MWPLLIYTCVLIWECGHPKQSHSSWVDTMVTNTLWHFAVVKKQLGHALLHVKCCCFVRNPHISSLSEERKETKFPIQDFCDAFSLHEYYLKSVDSICRDSMDTQYTIISELISHYNNVCSSSSVFMTNTPSGAKKHCRSSEPESRQMAKIFKYWIWTQFWREVEIAHSLADWDLPNNQVKGSAPAYRIDSQWPRPQPEHLSSAPGASAFYGGIGGC